MRADRLVSVVLLLRQRGQMSARELAQELEVSVRTVLRDIEALSTAGVPLYAERGRRGGFALLPGFRTELTGLTHDEALALILAGSHSAAHTVGLSSALAAAVLKVLDAVPEKHRAAAAAVSQRILIEPARDLLQRSTRTDDIPDDLLATVRRAVLSGHLLRVRYAALGEQAAWRVIDPLGLVAVAGRTYLLAIKDGAERTYRVSRFAAAEELREASGREVTLDLERLWHDRGDRFRQSGQQVVAEVHVRPVASSRLLETALAARSTPPTGPSRDVAADPAVADDRQYLELTFQDARHAVWAIWESSPDVTVLAPAWLRARIHERAAATADRHRG